MLSKSLRRANFRLLPGRLLYGPEWLVLGVNNICNLHCKMCDVGTAFSDSNFYYHLMGAQPVNMPLELARRILDQAARHYPEAKIGYAFTEPGIYPHLIESLDYAQSHKLYTTVTTNGLNLPQLAEDLSRVGLRELNVSLDGPPEVHNRIRGHPKSFERALSGIEKLLEQPGPKPAVSVYCTITEWNVGRLEEFLGFFHHLPLREVGFMHTNYTPTSVAEAHNRVHGATYPATASNMEGIDLAQMDLDRLWDEVEAIESNAYPFRVIFSPAIASRPGLDIFYREPTRLLGTLCNDAFRNIMIKSDGSVIPAHGRCYRVVAGSIYEQSLPEIWHSQPLAGFRKTLIKAGGLLPACSRCCSAF